MGTNLDHQGPRNSSTITVLCFEENKISRCFFLCILSRRMEGDWELIFLFFVVISTRSFDYVNHILFRRARLVRVRARSHMISILARWSASLFSSHLGERHLELRDFQIIVIMFFFHCWEFFYRFLVLLEGGEARCVFFACRC